MVYISPRFVSVLAGLSVQLFIITGETYPDPV